MAFDALFLEEAMNPEPVQPSLLNGDHRIMLAGLLMRLLADLIELLEQPRDIAGNEHMLRHSLASTGRRIGHQPFRSAQLHREEHCGKGGLNDLINALLTLH